MRQLLLAVIPLLRADERSHSYLANERVIVWADKCGPQQNPHETYSMEDLPTCELRDIRLNHKPLSIGDALEGHHFVESIRMHVGFRAEVESAHICSMHITETTAVELASKIAQNYWYLLYVDDLPIYAQLGQMPETEGKIQDVQIFTHRALELEYNGAQIVGIRLEPQNPVSLKLAEWQHDEALEFSYSVHWLPSDVPFNRRFDRYLDDEFLRNKIHWLSLVNSIIVSLMLCIVVASILLRTLRNDIATYAASDSAEIESLDLMDDSGWKQIHGEVFRRPPNLVFLTAFVSCGFHVTLAFFLVLVASLLRVSNKGVSNAYATLVSYAITSPLAGGVGGYWFRLYNGKKKKRTIIAQAGLLPLLVIAVFFFQHLVSWYYGSTVGLSLPKIALLVLVLIPLAFVLQVFGFLFGMRFGARSGWPCRINSIQRPIPRKNPFFIPLLISLSGFVGFGAALVETFFLYRSFWSYRFHQFFGFSLGIVLMYIAVAACASITSTYLLISHEDYRWPWVSFFSGSSAAFFALFYSVVFFLRSKMHGILQFTYFFSWSTFYCACAALAAGFVGFYASSRFLRLIYRSIKTD